MTNEDSSSQLNLTVAALVALVAIVGLVALVLNAMSVKTVQFATGSQQVSASNTNDKTVVGNAAKNQDTGSDAAEVLARKSSGQ